MPLPPSAFSAGRATTSAQDSEEDDWEKAYSRNEPRGNEESQNAKLWSDANAPMPAYTLMTSSTSSRLPPPAALAPNAGAPALTILKRPSSASSNTSTGTRTPGGREEKTLVQREKEYEEARRRIYGESAPSASVAKDKDDAGGALSKGVRDLSIGTAAGSRSASPRNAAGGASRNQREKGGGSRGSSSASLGAGEKAPADVVRAPKGPGDGRGGFGGDTGRSRGGKTVG